MKTMLAAGVATAVASVLMSTVAPAVASHRQAGEPITFRRAAPADPRPIDPSDEDRERLQPPPGASPPYEYNYPARPDGLAQIKRRFGEPCSANASANSNVVYANRALPNGTRETYRPAYHKKLGGWQSTGTSSNHDDVKYILQKNDLYHQVKGGVWGYSCRHINGSTDWSLHAWGAAIDINAAYEVYKERDCASNTVSPRVVNV